MRRSYCIMFMCLFLFPVTAAIPLGEDISVSLFSPRPLAPSQIADPHAGSTHINIMTTRDNPHEIWVTNFNGNKTYTPIAFKDADSSSRRYWRMKVGMNVGLLRFSFPTVEAKLNLQGFLNTLFEFYGDSDMVGFDGSYTVAAQVRFLHTWTAGFGIRHFSGHYGDEYLRRMYEYSAQHGQSLLNADGNSNYNRLVEYTRDNAWMLTAGYQPSEPWLFSVTALLPMIRYGSYIRPSVHAPDGSRNKPYGETIAEGEGVTHQRHSPWYIGLDLGLGAQYSHHFSEALGGTAGIYLQLHQDGQTKHMPGQYSPSNPWDVEFTAVAALDIFPDTPAPQNFRLELTYHTGRFPLQNFFYFPAQYIALGLGVGL